MQRKYLFFFIYSYSLKKRKREGQGIQSSLNGCKETDTFSVKNGINIGNEFIPGAVTPRIKLC